MRLGGLLGALAILRVLGDSAAASPPAPAPPLLDAPEARAAAAPNAHSPGESFATPPGSEPRLAVTMIACEETATARDDPWEALNRPLYRVHNGIDRAVLRPVALGYARIAPKFLRAGLRNLFANLHEPAVFINDTLQLRPKRAGVSLLRLATNTTLGVGGLVDVASHVGLKGHDNDFGVTLGRLHVPAGPYVFLPLVGPTTVRDALGAGVDHFADPLLWYRPDGTLPVEIGAQALNGLDKRANADPELEGLNATAVDPYAALRSGYLQMRQSAIRGGGDINVNDLPSFDEAAPAVTAPMPRDQNAPRTAPVAPAPKQPAPLPVPGPIVSGAPAQSPS